MASLNKVMLIGRLTRDPEPPRTLPNSGTTVVSFGFAVGRRRKNPQTGQWENDPNPLFIDCEVFSRTDARRDLCGLISKYTKKGTQLYLEGRLQLDSWEDKNGGGKRSKHRVVVENFEFLDPAQGSGGEGGEDEMGGASRGNFGGRGQAPRQNASQPAPGDDFDTGGQDQENIPF